MSTFYNTLVFIHIFSAILGMGPGFFLNLIPRAAKTMDELRLAYKIKHYLHYAVMVGGTLLIVSGLLMGAINPAWFRTGWYVTSLALFLLAMVAARFLLTPRSKPIKQLLATHQGKEIPEEYYTLFKKLTVVENLANVIFLIIIALMILKPF